MRDSCILPVSIKHVIFQHKEAYRVIISGVKGNSNTKRLASQFISRFLKHFPDLAEEALDALFDLCEDEDINVIIFYQPNTRC